MLTRNLILDTDSYKASHFKQYPPGTTYMFDYLESRGGRYDCTLFFGLQALIKEYLTTPVTMEMVDEAKAFFDAHGEPFPYDGWKHIVDKCGGYLPVRIRAVPEGSVVPVHNVLLTIESTDPEVFWIVSWLETQLLRVWYPTTVATQSFYIKKRIQSFLLSTGDNAASLPFKLHDFGSRGVSSRESAALGGMAHLVNFMGSDTIEGVRAANYYYDHPMAGFSIPAAEHSTITVWGRDNEEAAYRNMLDQFAQPGKIVAIVADSYNIYKACENLFGDKLREQITKSGATVVIRPDSGRPDTVVVRCLEILSEKFGYTLTSKNYKLLPPCIRVIQGDGINEDSILDILAHMKKNNFAADNVGFGMGGGLLQQVNRDTQRFAIKCSSACVNGTLRDVYKAPITDDGKASKKGLLSLDLDGTGSEYAYRTYHLSEHGRSTTDMLPVVFENGELKLSYTLNDIRKRSEQALDSAERRYMF